MSLGGIIGVLAGVAVLVGIWAACEHEKHKDNMSEALPGDGAMTCFMTSRLDPDGRLVPVQVAVYGASSAATKAGADYILNRLKSFDVLLAVAKDVRDNLDPKRAGINAPDVLYDLNLAIANAEATP